MYRTRKSTLKYKPDKQRDSLKSGQKPCPFCKLDKSEVVKTTKYNLVTINSFGYQYWEFMDVTDHLMIIPKRHVDSMSDLSKEEKLDLINLMADYEAKGYNVYSREKESNMKSVVHQHTHLIKTKNNKARFVLYFRKPYFLVKK